MVVVVVVGGGVGFLIVFVCCCFCCCCCIVFYFASVSVCCCLFFTDRCRKTVCNSNISLIQYIHAVYIHNKCTKTDFTGITHNDREVGMTTIYHRT